MNMVPAGEGEGGAGATSSVASSSSSAKKGKKFEIKKWNAVALWAWGMYLTVVRVMCIDYSFGNPYVAVIIYVLHR